MTDTIAAMRPRSLIVVLAACLGLAIGAAEAPAKGPPTDPRPGSPSEAVYGIPLERARRDAAPGGRSGQASRSEMGVGSSALVPGTRAELELRGAGDPPEGGDRSGIALAILLVGLAALAVAGGVVGTRAAHASRPRDQEQA